MMSRRFTITPYLWTRAPSVRILSCWSDSWKQSDWRAVTRTTSHLSGTGKLPDTRAFLGEVTAAIAARKLFSAGSFGVFIENLPALDPQQFVNTLSQLGATKRVRLAALGSDASVKGKNGVEVTRD